MGNELVIREVEFNGGQLLGVQDESGKVYLGVAKACQDIGLTEKQKDRQVSNIQTDLVLSMGCKKLSPKFEGQGREILLVELDFIPLWLAKISITPKMQTENPIVVQKLIDYQIKAKDVLAKAFINKVEIDQLLLEDLTDRSIKYGILMDSKDMIDMLKLSHILNIKNFGRTKLFRYLRNKKVLMQVDNRKNCPYEKYKLYFDVIEQVSQKGHITYKTLVNTKGQNFILDMLIKDGITEAS